MGRILVIADINDKCFATPRGLELAHRLGYSTEVVAFAYDSLRGLKVSAEEKAAIKQRLLDEREAIVKGRVERYRHQGQDVSVRVVWGKDVASWVVRHAGKGYLAVVKTGHRSGSMVYTSTDWQLLRNCPAPVLIVAEKKWHNTKPILAAVDLGTRSRVKRALNVRVIEIAQRLAEGLQAELRLICAIEPPAVLSELNMIDPIAYTKQQREAMAPYLGELVAAHQLSRGAFKVKRGPVAKVITSEAAELRAQLVVMGTVGRTGVKARLLGNTAESVLALLNTDVLALKP
jgi:universal stress protein E